MISDTFKRFIDWITHVDYRHIFLDIANFIGDIMHRALFDLLLPKKYRTLTKQEIFTIIFKSDTPRGKKFDIWLLILIGLNVMVIMLESVSDAPKWFTLSMNSSPLSSTCASTAWNIHANTLSPSSASSTSSPSFPPT